jgi:hypothetical protein
MIVHSDSLHSLVGFHKFHKLDNHHQLYRPLQSPDYLQKLPRSSWIHGLNSICKLYSV